MLVFLFRFPRLGMLLTVSVLVRDYELIMGVPFTSWKATVFACNMHTQAKNVTLDAHSGNISQSEDLSRTVRTTWEQWQQPELSNDTLTLIVSIPIAYSSLCSEIATTVGVHFQYQFP